MSARGSVTRRQREEQRQVVEQLRADARKLADRFGLALRAVDAERPQVKRRYGICYEDGSIRIRLRNLRTGELLRYSGLVDTLCHELAHLRHFDHGPRFHALYRRILQHARECGIYRPHRRGRGFTDGRLALGRASLSVHAHHRRRDREDREARRLREATDSDRRRRPVQLTLFASSEF